jgi:hypothetical protein
MENQIEGPHSATPASSINNLAAPQATGNSFMLQLFNNGVSIGYVGVNSSNWCVLVTDISQATKFSQYINGGINYYMANGSYLSISHNAYAGLYGWLGACGWVFEADGTFLCQYNNQHLSLYSNDNAYLYAWDAYTVLTVKQV